MTNLPWDTASPSQILNDLTEAKHQMRMGVQVLPEGNEFGMIKGADSIAIVSGGLDSVTLVYHMMLMGYTPHMLSFDYGQRHKKELQFARAAAKKLNLHHDIVDLTGITHLISNSALTSQTGLTVGGKNFVNGDFHPNIEVPEGHYAEDTMKATVVPNRNMIMLSIAAGVAVSRCYKTIGIGVHGGDHFIYPDCRPSFIHYANQAIGVGNDGFGDFKLDPTGTYHEPIYSPFIHKTKADIAYMALELGVPLHMTWSCYKGGENHCGRCGTCVERLEAIDEAMVRWANNQNDQNYIKAPKGQNLTIGGPSILMDQTVYDDNEFWRTAVKNAGKIS